MGVLGPGILVYTNPTLTLDIIIIPQHREEETERERDEMRCDTHRYRVSDRERERVQLQSQKTQAKFNYSATDLNYRSSMTLHWCHSVSSALPVLWSPFGTSVTLSLSRTSVTLHLSLSLLTMSQPIVDIRSILMSSLPPTPPSIPSRPPPVDDVPSSPTSPLDVLVNESVSQPLSNAYRKEKADFVKQYLERHGINQAALSREALGDPNLICRFFSLKTGVRMADTTFNTSWGKLKKYIGDHEEEKDDEKVEEQEEPLREKLKPYIEDVANLSRPDRQNKVRDFMSQKGVTSKDLAKLSDVGLTQFNTWLSSSSELHMDNKTFNQHWESISEVIESMNLTTHRIRRTSEPLVSTPPPKRSKPTPPPPPPAPSPPGGTPRAGEVLADVLSVLGNVTVSFTALGGMQLSFQK
jgi:hypothetical protein